MIKNNLRVWGVWDNVISRLEYLSESQSDCRNMIRLFQKSNRRGVELVRFDLSPLYYDNSSSSPLPAPVTRWRREGDLNNKTAKTKSIKETEK